MVVGGPCAVLGTQGQHFVLALQPPVLDSCVSRVVVHLLLPARFCPEFRQRHCHLLPLFSSYMAWTPWRSYWEGKHNQHREVPCSKGGCQRKYM